MPDNSLDKNIRDKMKRSGIGIVKYGGNVGKSFLHMGKYMVKNEMPTLFSYGELNKEIVSDTIKAVRNPAGALGSKFSQMKNSSTYSALMDVTKNALDDIRTGKFYDERRDRTEIGLETESMLSDFGGIDFSDYGSEDFAANESSSDRSDDIAVTIAQVQENNADSRASATVSAIGSATGALIANQNAQHDLDIKVRMKQHDQTMTGMKNMTMASVANYEMTNAMMTEMLNMSRDANAEISQKLTDITNILTDIRKNTQASTQIAAATLEDSNPFKNGALDLKKYMKTVRKNVDTRYDVSGMVSMLTQGMSTKDLLELYKSNPIGGLITTAIRGMAPKDFFKQLSEFDKSLKSFGPAALLKLGNSKDKDGNDSILSLLGIKNSPTKKIKTDYNMGKVDFTGKTDKAITEVIPMLLASINSALTGNDFKVYDYRAGRFVNATGEMASAESQLNSHSGSYSARRKLSSSMKYVKSDLIDTNGKMEKFEAAIDKLFDKLTEDQSMLDLFSTDYDSRKKRDKVNDLSSEIFGNGGRSKEKMNLLMGLMRSLDRKDLISIPATTATLGLEYDKKNQRVMDDLKERGLLSIYSELDPFLEDYRREVGKVGSNTSKVDLRKLRKDGNHISAIPSVLSDIRDILTRGIITYSYNVGKLDSTGSSFFNSVVQDEQAKVLKALNDRRDRDEDERRDRDRMDHLERGYIGGAIPLTDANAKTIAEQVRAARIAEENAKSRLSGVPGINGNLFSSKTSANMDNLKTLVRSPFETILTTLDIAEGAMFKFLYGEDYGDVAQLNGGGLFSAMSNMFGGLFTKTSNILSRTVNDKFLEPITTKLFDPTTGIVTSFVKDRVNPYIEKGTNRAKRYLMGDRTPQLDENGNPVFDAEGNPVYSGRSGGIFSSAMNRFGGYKDRVVSRGKDYLGMGQDRSKSFIGKMDTYFFGNKTQGPVDANGRAARDGGGLFSRLGQSIKGNFDRFNEFMFGTDNVDGSPSKSRKLFGDIKDEVSKAMPDTVIQAGIGAGAVAGVGMLTGLFLPGGPLLGGIIGGITGLVSGSDKLKEFLFGENGIDSELVDGFKKYAPKIGIGAGLGALAGGLGLLPFGLGSMAGAVMGSMGGMVAASDQLKEILFGNTDDSSSGLLSKDNREKFLKDVLPVGLVTGVGAGVLSSALASGIGILPALPFLPGGPVVGLVAGLAGAFNADRIKNFFFGEGEPYEITNPDGSREVVPGKPGMFVRLFDVTKEKLFQPMIDGINTAGHGIASWFQESIVKQLAEAVDPMKQEIAKARDHIALAFRNVGTAISGAFHSVFEKAIGLPMEDFAEKYLFKPLREMSSRLFTAAGKIIGGLISAPFKLINAMFVDRDGKISEDSDIKDKMKAKDRLEKLQKRQQSRDEKRAKKAYDKLPAEQKADKRNEQVVAGVTTVADILRDIRDIFLGRVADGVDVVSSSYSNAKDAVRGRTIESANAARQKKLLRDERRETSDIKRKLKAESKQKAREDKRAKNDERKRQRQEDRIRNMEEIDGKRDAKGRSRAGKKSYEQNVADTAHYTRKLVKFLEDNISGIGYDVRYIRNMLLKQHGALGPGERPEAGPASGKVPKKYSMFARATSWLSDKGLGVKNWTVDKMDKARGLLGYILQPVRIIKDGISAGMSVVKNLLVGSKEFFKGILGSIGHTLKTTFDSAISFIGSGVVGIGKMIKEAAGGIGAGIGSIAKELGSALGGLLGVVSGVTQGIAAFVKEAAPEMGKGLAKLIVGGVKLVGKGVFHGAKAVGKGVVGLGRMTGRGIGRLLGIKPGHSVGDENKKIGKVIGAYVLGGSLDKVDDLKATIMTKLDGIGTKVELKQVSMLGPMAMATPSAALPVYIAGSYDDQPAVINTQNRKYRNISRDIQSNSKDNSDVYDKLAANAKSKADMGVLQSIHTFNTLAGGASAGPNGEDPEDKKPGGIFSVLKDLVKGKGGAILGALGLGGLVAKGVLGPALLSGGALVGGTVNAFNQGNYGQAAENIGRAAIGLGGKSIANYAVRGMSANALGPASAKSIAGRAAAEGAEKTLAGKASRAIMGAIKKFFSVKLIIDKLGSAIASKLSNKLTRAIGEKLSKGLLARIGASSIKLLGGPATVAVFAVADFTTGFAQAANILKIRSSAVDVKMRLTAGVAKAISGLTFGLITEDFIAELIYPVIVSDEEERSFAQERSYMEQQAAQLGMSVADYNEKVANPTLLTKMKNFFTGGPSTSTSTNKSAGSYYGGKGPGTDHFVQTDSRWNSGAYSKYQISKVGCGPTVAAMMVGGKGPGPNPIEASQMSVNMGYRDPSGGTDPAFFSQYGAMHGRPMSAGPVDPNAFRQALSSGQKIALMGADRSGGVFGSNMHYIMADGIDKNGNVIVKDPLRKGSRKYPMRQILGGTATAIYGTGDEATTEPASVMDGISSLFGSLDTAIGNAVSKAYGLSTGSSQGSSSGFASGNDNASLAWNFLKRKGFSDAAAAGILGNLEAESGINPKNLENSYERKLGHTDDSYASSVDSGTYKNFANDRAGYGLAQWTSGGRKKGLYDLAKSRGTSIADLNTQLEWLWTEFVGRGLSNNLITTSSVKDMSTWMLQKFEIPKDYKKQYMIDKRYNMAMNWYNRFTGTSGGTLSKFDSNYSGLDDFFIKNIPGAKKTQGYGNKSSLYSSGKHDGIDYGAPAGATIRTPVAGIVATSTFNNSYGNYVKIRDGKGNNHTFAHMLKPSNLAIGTKINVGDVVGQVGSTGHSTGNHLHYDVWMGGKRVNPYTYYANGMGPGISYKPGTNYGTNALSQLAKSSNVRISRGRQDANDELAMALLSNKIDRVANSTQESAALAQFTAVMSEVLVVLKSIDQNTAKPTVIAKSDTYNDNRQPATPTARPTANRGISAGTYMIDKLTAKV